MEKELNNCIVFIYLCEVDCLNGQLDKRMANNFTNINDHLLDSAFDQTLILFVLGDFLGTLYWGALFAPPPSSFSQKLQKKYQ